MDFWRSKNKFVLTTLGSSLKTIFSNKDRFFRNYCFSKFFEWTFEDRKKKFVLTTLGSSLKTICLNKNRIVINYCISSFLEWTFEDRKNKFDLTTLGSSLKPSTWTKTDFLGITAFRHFWNRLLKIEKRNLF